ncbi:MAG: glycosyltransferase family 2 protein [Syntrophotaleaceae bacterium]
MPATLASLAANPQNLLAETLVLLVVNQRPDSTAADKADNLLLLQQLKTGALNYPGVQLAWVDASASGQELPAKDGGVGLARKIGFDLALSRLAWRPEDPLLVALDADTLVQPDYLSALRRHFRVADAGAAVVPFCHQSADDPAQQQAITRYELFLRCHVLGLKLAGSPYAFHTVGSTMACRATAYARAGGMNRRRAGEDFYFLQQLAKTTGVQQLSGTQVFPSPRPSNRTPFGTGRSVAELMAGHKEAVLFYPAPCYRLLGDWLQLVETRLETDGATLLHQARQLNPDLAEFFAGENFIFVWERLAANHPRPQSRIKAFHDWFDGLKTTRLIHHLCAGPYPRCAPQKAVPQLLQHAGLAAATDTTEQLNILRRHQGAMT